MRAVIDPVASRQASAGSAVRTIYAILLIALSLFMGWLVIKPAIYTESPGEVLAPEYILSTPYDASVIEVLARPGSRVKAGDVLARVRSPRIDELMTSLATGIAVQTNAIAELRIRQAVAQAVLPAAQRRSAAARENVRRLGEDGCTRTTSLFCAEVYREEALASIMLAETQAGLAEMKGQLQQLNLARQTIQEMQERVTSAFNNGNQTSPVDGLVGPRHAPAGQSVGPGDTIAQVFDDSQPYIQWVMSASRFRQPAIGDPVYVLDGQLVMRGRISELLAVSDLAPSRSSIFQEADTGQLVRIELQRGESYPPLMSKIEVRYNYWRVLDQAVELYVAAMERLGVWRHS